MFAEVLQPFGEPFTARLVDDFVWSSSITSCDHWMGVARGRCFAGAPRYIMQSAASTRRCWVSIEGPETSNLFRHLPTPLFSKVCWISQSPTSGVHGALKAPCGRTSCEKVIQQCFGFRWWLADKKADFVGPLGFGCPVFEGTLEVSCALRFRVRTLSRCLPLNCSWSMSPCPRRRKVSAGRPSNRRDHGGPPQIQRFFLCEGCETQSISQSSLGGKHGSIHGLCQSCLSCATLFKALASLLRSGGWHRPWSPTSLRLLLDKKDPFLLLSLELRGCNFKAQNAWAQWETLGSPLRDVLGEAQITPQDPYTVPLAMPQNCPTKRGVSTFYKNETDQPPSHPTTQPTTVFIRWDNDQPQCLNLHIGNLFAAGVKPDFNTARKNASTPADQRGVISGTWRPGLLVGFTR